MPKMPVVLDFQFYDSKRLNVLIEKEKKAIMAKHEMSLAAQEGGDQAQFPEIVELSEDEQAERDKLLEEGFHDWTKRDLSNYIKACERWGRHNTKEVSKEVEGKTEEQVKLYHTVFWKRYDELEDKEKIIKRIEDGEAKINRRLETEALLKEKVSKYTDPFNQLAISYEGQSTQLKATKFNEEEDRYLLCMSQKLGYGNWEGIKAELRNAPQFRFDWYIKSRTPAELGRRVESLIRMVEKEKEIEAHHKNVLIKKRKKTEQDKAKEVKKAKVQKGKE